MTQNNWADRASYNADPTRKDKREINLWLAIMYQKGDKHSQRQRKTIIAFHNFITLLKNVVRLGFFFSDERSKSWSESFFQEGLQRRERVEYVSPIILAATTEIYYLAKEARVVPFHILWLSRFFSFFFLPNWEQEAAVGITEGKGELSLRHDVITVSCLFKLP